MSSYPSASTTISLVMPISIIPSANLSPIVIPYFLISILRYSSFFIKKFSDELSTVNTKALSGLKNDKDKAFAALYRFYSHVQLIDSCYVCSLKSAAEINVSQTVFETLKNNLDDMNEQIESLRKAGEKVSLPDFDNDYLKSLLR